MKAKELMTKNVVCVFPDMGINEALSVMREIRVRHLPVVAGRRLLGILSDRDILPFTKGGVVVETRTVEEVMSEAPITAEAHASIARIAELMLDYRIDAIPIMRDQQLAGLITSSDLLGLLAGADEPKNQTLPFDFHFITPSGEAAFA